MSELRRAFTMSASLASQFSNGASWGTSRPKPASNSCTISAVTVPQNDAEGRELEAGS